MDVLLTKPFNKGKYDLIRKLGVNLTIIDEKEITTWFSDQIYERRFNVVYHNLINYLNKRRLENAVKLIKGY